MAARCSYQRPEQTAKAHAAEKLEREAVVPRVLGKIEERAGARRARRVENVAATVTLRHQTKHRLATVLPAQISSTDVWTDLGAAGDAVSRRFKICLRQSREHRLCALGRECRSAAPADAAAPTGDYDALPREFPCRGLACSAV